MLRLPRAGIDDPSTSLSIPLNSNVWQGSVVPLAQSLAPSPPTPVPLLLDPLSVCVRHGGRPLSLSRGCVDPHLQCSSKHPDTVLDFPCKVPGKVHWPQISPLPLWGPFSRKGSQAGRRVLCVAGLGDSNCVLGVLVHCV
jgi:hypothetical protein